MNDDRQKVEGTKADRKKPRGGWSSFDVTPEMVIIGLFLLAFFANEKEIYISVTSGLIGYLTRKVTG